MTGKEEFATGAVRDSQEDKPRFDLITPTFMLRLATLLGEKAKHYGDRNWEQGINTSRSFASLERHVQAIKRGDRSEDHIAQAAANLMFLAEEQDGPNDDLHELWGPSIRRDKEDAFDELMAGLCNTSIQGDTDEECELNGWTEPDRKKIYDDTFGNTWLYSNGYDDWVIKDKNYVGIYPIGNWETVKSHYKHTFPWRKVA